MLLAAAATAFTSCDKQNAEATQSPEESVLVFTSEKPSFDDDVKTEWNEIEKTVYWSKGDNIFMSYTVGGVWQDKDGSISGGEKAKFYASTKLSSSCKTAEFIVSDNFLGTTQGEHKFYGVFPNSCTNNDFAAPIATLNVASNQTLSSSSFHSDADIMIAESVGTYDSRPATAIPMKWNRIVAHTVITLADLKGSVDGEIVSSVTLTADTDAAMVGKFDVDITTRGFELNDGNTTANILTLSGGELTVEEGDVSFWACMMPCTWKSLTVVVDTDKATYTREIDLTGKEKTFLQNRRNLLTINMADAVRTPKAVSTANYEKVISAPADWKGEYLIVVYTSEKYYVFDQKNTGTWGTVTLIEESDGKIELSTTTGDFAITIEDGTTEDTYSIKLKDNTYISGGAKDKLNVLENNTSTKTDMNISINDDKTINIQSVYKTDATRRIQSGSGGIRFYDDNTTQPLPFLYKLVNNN